MKPLTPRPADNYAERFRVARAAAKAERLAAKARRIAHQRKGCATCHLPLPIDQQNQECCDYCRWQP